MFEWYVFVEVICGDFVAFGFSPDVDVDFGFVFAVWYSFSVCDPFAYFYFHVVLAPRLFSPVLIGISLFRRVSAKKSGVDDVMSDSRYADNGIGL